MAKQTYTFEWDGKRHEFERPRFDQFEKLVDAQSKLDSLEKAKQYGREWTATVRDILRSANIPDDIIATLYDNQIGAFYVAVTQGLYPGGGDEGNPEGGGSL